MKVMGGTGGFVGGQFFVVIIRVVLSARFWGSGGPSEKRI